MAAGGRAEFPGGSRPVALGVVRADRRRRDPAARASRTIGWSSVVRSRRCWGESFFALIYGRDTAFHLDVVHSPAWATSAVGMRR